MGMLVDQSAFIQSHRDMAPPPVNQNQPAQGLQDAGVPAGIRAVRGPGQVPQAPIQQLQVAQMQGQATAGREGLFSRIGTWLRKAFTGLPQGIPAQMNLNINGQPITISGERIKTMLTALPKTEREQALAQLPAQLNQRLNHAQTLFTNVLNGTHNAPASSADVAELMLFLHVRSEAQGLGFNSGAFNVEDTAGHLYDFLNSCPEKYLRSSSHMENEQSAMVGNPAHMNVHRGIDIPPGVNGLLDDSSTVLFAVIPGHDGQGQRLFFKAESHGCRLSTLSQNQREQGADTQHQERDVRLTGDIKNTISHMFSFLATRGTGSAAGSHKERIPDSVKNSFKDLCKTIRKDNTLPQPLRTALLTQLQQNAPLDNAHGVRDIAQNLRQTIASIQVLPPAQRSQALGHLSPLLTALHSVGQQSHFGARIGNEIMIDSADIQAQPQVYVPDELALERFLLNAPNLNLPQPLVAPGLRLATALENIGQ